ncbi:MAG: type II toxin-antitoxin system HicB family antitoxin [Bacteroidales bacterium]|nr:type II toxin-antitoxin system HicB family antitoxin [Bacteroidales bacterium]
MNTLKYKGYIGSVAYSEADKVFFGKIEGIDGLVNYEGESVAELTAAFEQAVDDYLIFCEEHGVKLDKSYTGTFNVRVSPVTHRELALLARAAGVSINAFVKQVLDEAVRQPLSEHSHGIDYYGNDRGVACLAEPASHSYGDMTTITLRLPAKDVKFAKDLAERMSWKAEAAD